MGDSLCAVHSGKLCFFVLIWWPWLSGTGGGQIAEGSFLLSSVGVCQCMSLAVVQLCVVLKSFTQTCGGACWVP